MKKRQRIRKGMLIITFLIFPAVFYYLPPYLIIDGTLKGIVSGSFIFFILLFVNSLILGRLLSIPSLHLNSKHENCANCHTCTSNCPMSLPVEEMVAQRKMENTECILCGTCVDGCKSKAIEFNFGTGNFKVKGSS